MERNMKRIFHLFLFLFLNYFINANVFAGSFPQQYNQLTRTITVNDDLSVNNILDVTVTATEQHNGGIKLWLPVIKKTWKAKNGKINSSWDFKLYNINQVLLDQKPTPFNIEQDKIYDRLGIDSDPNLSISLSPGEHTFTFDWTKREEVYHSWWTGEFVFAQYIVDPGWGYPIDNVSAKIKLPIGAIIQAYRFTGHPDWIYPDKENAAQNVMSYQSNYQLPAGQPIAINVQWIRDWAKVPGWINQSNNFKLFFLLSFIYYFLFWYFSIRIPKGNLLFSIKQPPDNISPTIVSYLMDRRDFLNNRVKVALISLATKGLIRIVKNEKYSVELDEKIADVINSKSSNLSSRGSLNNKKELSYFELKHRYVISALSIFFGEKLNTQDITYSSIATKEENEILNLLNKKEMLDNLKEIKLRLHNSLLQQGCEMFFKNKFRYLIPGIFLSLVALWFSFQWYKINFFFFLIIFIAGPFLYYLVEEAYSILRKIFKYFTMFLLIINLIPLCVLFVGVPVFIFIWLDVFSGFSLETWQSVEFLLLSFMNGAVFFSFRVRTEKGKQITQKILAFKSFLSDNSPIDQVKEDPLKLFQQYLPYAVALGVEKQWAKKFIHIAPVQKPDWYEGAWPKDINLIKFTQDLSEGLTFY